MSRRTVRIPLLLAATFCVLVSLPGRLAVPPSQASPLGVNLGDRAPDFDLVDLDGARHTLSAERGSVVLLYFFGNSATVCRNPARQISEDLLGSYGSRGLRVYGIDCWDGAWQAVDAFRQQTDVQFPLLMLGSSTAAAYDVSYNSFVIVDSRGVIRYLSAGPENAFDPGAMRTSIERLLEESNQTKEATWGAIKSLFGTRKMRPLV